MISDKYVIVGAHIDSWIQGAVDSGTGYTIMQELSRSFAYHIGKGLNFIVFIIKCEHPIL